MGAQAIGNHVEQGDYTRNRSNKQTTVAEKRTVAKRKGLIKYYQKNESRMQYHEFLEKELLMGSGAIESAHKDVMQQRLKRSGQR